MPGTNCLRQIPLAEKGDATIRAEGMRRCAAVLAGVMLGAAVDAGLPADQASAAQVDSAIEVVHTARR